MNLIKQKDLNFGLKQEEIQQEKIENKYGKLHKLDRFNNFDYYNEQYYIELKSRRIKHNQYSTLFFNKKKLDKANEVIKKGYKVIFIWNCIDGLYCWEYTGENKQLDEYYIAVGGRCDRGKDEYDDLVNVKVKYITNIY